MKKYRIVVTPQLNHLDIIKVQQRYFFGWWTFRERPDTDREFVNVSSAKRFIDSQIELDKFNKEQKKRIIYYP